MAAMENAAARPAAEGSKKGIGPLPANGENGGFQWKPPPDGSCGMWGPMRFKTEPDQWLLDLELRASIFNPEKGFKGAGDPAKSVAIRVQYDPVTRLDSGMKPLTPQYSCWYKETSGDLKEGEKMCDTSEFFIIGCSKSPINKPQRLGNKAHKWLHVWNPALPPAEEKAKAPAAE